MGSATGVVAQQAPRDDHSHHCWGKGVRDVALTLWAFEYRTSRDMRHWPECWSKGQEGNVGVAPAKAWAAQVKNVSRVQKNRLVV